MSEEMLVFIAVGFLAQLIDGSIGMAYGVTASSVLLASGVAPSVASASVHAAEVFTTGASGYAHWRLGNVDRRLVVRLVVPGMIGGAIGATVLAHLPGEAMRVWISGYLLVLGVVILWKAWRARPAAVSSPALVPPLGFIGGLLDAIGGGGWGPLVTSSLIGNGSAPRTTIGSVNCAEFFVTTTISATFLATIGVTLWPVIAGLVIGGVIAAPLSALATKHLPARVLIAIVGVVVIVVSLRTLVRALAG